jgi:hypothetical protein
MNEQEARQSQIPYEVYETIHGPTVRRRRWVVRLVASLLVVTLLIIGGTALKSKLDTANDPQASQSGSTDKAGQSATGGSAGGSNSGQTNTASQQSPQANAPLQKSDSDPATTPQSGATNTGTIKQPE